MTGSSSKDEQVHVDVVRKRSSRLFFLHHDWFGFRVGSQGRRRCGIICEYFRLLETTPTIVPLLAVDIAAHGFSGAWTGWTLLLSK
jgi:hypothetical protein